VDLFARFAQRLFPPADKKHPRAEFATAKPWTASPVRTGKKMPAFNRFSWNKFHRLPE